MLKFSSEYITKIINMEQDLAVGRNELKKALDGDNKVALLVEIDKMYNLMGSVRVRAEIIQAGFKNLKELLMIG